MIYLEVTLNYMLSLGMKQEVEKILKEGKPGQSGKVKYVKL